MKKARMTYNQLYEEVTRVAESLRDMGAKPGDRVCAYLPNLIETAIAMLATTSIGGVWAKEHVIRVIMVYRRGLGYCLYFGSRCGGIRHPGVRGDHRWRRSVLCWDFAVFQRQKAFGGTIGMRADGTAASLAASVRGKTRNPGQLGEFEDELWLMRSAQGGFGRSVLLMLTKKFKKRTRATTVGPDR